MNLPSSSVSIGGGAKQSARAHTPVGALRAPLELLADQINRDVVAHEPALVNDRLLHAQIARAAFPPTRDHYSASRRAGEARLKGMRYDTIYSVAPEHICHDSAAAVAPAPPVQHALHVRVRT